MIGYSDLPTRLPGVVRPLTILTLDPDPRVVDTIANAARDAESTDPHHHIVAVGIAAACADGTITTYRCMGSNGFLLVSAVERLQHRLQCVLDELNP